MSCKENYGIFIPGSEANKINDDASKNNSKVSTLLAKDDNSPEETSYVDFKTRNDNMHTISPLDDSQSVLPKNVLNESYTISKGFYTDELPVINEETFENIKYQDSVNFSGFDIKADFSKCENFQSTKQFLERGSSSFQESEEPHQDFEENYDSDDSLGILPHLISDNISCDDLTFDLINPSTDLNTTVILPNSAVDLNKCQVVSKELDAVELLASPICIMQNVSSFTKSDESPVYNPTSIPKYASTPKHETNYSYVISDALHSTQNFSCGFQPNKVLEKDGSEIDIALYNKSSAEYISPIIANTLTPVTDENKDPEKNILNVTCNILDPFNTNQSLLNKTFGNLNVIVDEECTLPLVKSHAIDVLKTDYNQLIQHTVPEEYDAVASHFQSHEEQENVFFENQNILNRTCDIVKVSNTNVIENVESKENSENQKDIAIDALNTTSFPGELENKFQTLNFGENVAVYDKTGVLNTTYEKLDEPSTLLTGKKNISFPRDSTSLKDESGNKCPAFDKKRIQRKSVGCFGRTNIINAELKNKQTQNRRNSLASNTYTSSKGNETMIISQAHDKGMPTKYSVKENTSKNATSNKQGLIDPSLKSKILTKKTEEVKPFAEVELKTGQVSLLNQTINLTPPTPDIGKTVVKKQRISLDLPRYKIRSKSMIPASEKPSSLKICATAKDVAIVESNKGMSTLISKSSLKKPSVVSTVTLGEKRTTRIPEKQVLSEKNTCTSIHSSAANLGRSRSTIPALKSTNYQDISQSRNMRHHLIQKVNLNDTVSISDRQSSSERSVKPVSKATGHIPIQSRIPSLSQGKKKQVAEVKSSLMIPRRKESTSRKLKSPSRYNLR